MTPAEMDALRDVAPRVVWFKTPVEAMADEAYFLTYALARGTMSDIRTVRHVIGDARIGRALDSAPPGLLTARQWTCLFSTSDAVDE